MVETSVVIVTWNSARFILNCLASIPADSDVVVVDNASTDNTVRLVRAEFPRVKLIVNTRNTGYAHANNQGLAEFGIRNSECGIQNPELSNRFIALLNPDTVLPSGGLERMLSYADAHPEIGVVAPKLVDSDGMPQRSVRRFPTYRNMLGALFGPGRAYFAKGFDYETTQAVEQPMASCLLFRREVFEQVGLFDDQFPMFFNDVDLLKRVREAGWGITYYPEVSVWHYLGGSTEKRRVAMIWSMHQSLFRYFLKHDHSGWFWLRAIPLALVVELAALIRIVTSLFRSRPH